jgi:translation initiation factor eIF-2B subunit epsilon
VDCSIDICSPDVLDIYKEGFQEKRINFIKEDILADEVMDYKMNCHILTNEYASRVSNLRSYEIVTSEIMRRWVYPIVPEAISEINYRRTRENNYFSQDIKLERSCSIESDTIIGKKTFIDKNTKINQSTIGNNVKIGKNCDIQNCYIFDHVVIEDNVKMSHCMICDYALIGENSTLSTGLDCLFFNVRLHYFL